MISVYAGERINLPIQVKQLADKYGGLGGDKDDLVTIIKGNYD